MEGIEDGHYYKKQIDCKSRVIAWSHRSRFEFALKLSGDAPGSILDYGCGDGTFLAMLEHKASFACGVDIADSQIEECAKRFGDRSIMFHSINSEMYKIRPEGFDLVTCMETLEHCTEPVVDIVLNDLAKMVSKKGRVIISVPIEIGPVFLGKKVVRGLAAWRGLSDYKYYEKYSIANSLKMIFATKSTIIPRPEYGNEGGKYHSHYGFNWKYLAEKISNHLVIKKKYFTPIGWSKGYLSSQAWFDCVTLNLDG